MRGALDVCGRRSGVTAVLFVANGFVIVSFVAVVLWYYMKQKSKHIVQWMPCTLPLIQFAMRAEETLRRTMDPDITDEEEVDLRYEWSHFLPAANGRLFTKGTAYTVRKRTRQAGLTFGDAVRKLEERFARERGDTRDDETLVDLSIAPGSPSLEGRAVLVDPPCLERIGDSGSGAAVGVVIACGVGGIVQGGAGIESGGAAGSDAGADDVGAGGLRYRGGNTGDDIVEARERCGLSFAAALEELSRSNEGSGTEFHVIQSDEIRVGRDIEINRASAEEATLALESEEDEDEGEEVAVDFDTNASTDDSSIDGDSSGSMTLDVVNMSESSGSDGDELLSSALFAHSMARVKEKRETFAL